MAVIFKNLIEETLSKASKFIKNNRILVRFTSFALVSVAALVVCIISCGITIGFNVKYEGKNIAVVSNASVFKAAKDTVLNNLADENDNNIIAKPKFSLTVTSKENLCCEESLVNEIINNTDGIFFSSSLTVNGQVVAYAEREELKNLISTALCKYYVEGAENTATFVDEVVINDGYCLEENKKDSNQLKELIGGLKVKTVSTVTTESDVKFSTKTVYTSSKQRGYEEIQTKGEIGLKTETAVVETVNGEETVKTIISSQVIKEPVQQVVLKGTAVSYASATAKAEAKSAGFIHPMNKGDIKAVSSYWGDGRNHQGMDFSGRVGVPIFAAMAGKVVAAGWDGNYGYAVVIDHGNGFKTRYAHASALCVRTGETVTQGQQIAKLGNTGRSTGPHLHFEVIKNGTRVNPAPYIGY